MKLLLEIESDKNGTDFPIEGINLKVDELLKSMEKYHVKIKQFSLEV